MIFRNNIIYDNQAVKNAGVLINGVNVRGFSNNTITENSSELQGGGICILINAGASSELHGVNNIVYNNTTGGSNSDIECLDGKCLLTYSCSRTKINGTGNITKDPLFVNPDNGDFHLTKNSPCIDTGDPDSPKDPDSTRADMGALYFPQGSGIINKGFKTTGAIAIQVLQGNRFTLSVPAEGEYGLSLFTLDGQLLKSHTAYLFCGKNSIIWNISDCIQGVAILRIVSGTVKTEKTITILK